jgi:hypothetical protein
VAQSSSRSYGPRWLYRKFRSGAELPPSNGESLVDFCGDTPIEIDGGMFHIDVPFQLAVPDVTRKISAIWWFV